MTAEALEDGHPVALHAQLRPLQFEAVAGRQFSLILEQTDHRRPEPLVVGEDVVEPVEVGGLAVADDEVQQAVPLPLMVTLPLPE